MHVHPNVPPAQSLPLPDSRQAPSKGGVSQGRNPCAGAKARQHTVMDGNVLRLFQKHLLFQPFAALSAEAIAADDDHLGAMQEAIQAR